MMRRSGLHAAFSQFRNKPMQRLGVICLVGGVAIVALLGSLYVYRVPVRLEVYPGNRYKIITTFIWPTLRSNLDELPKKVDVVGISPNGTRIKGIVWWNNTNHAVTSPRGGLPISVRRIWGHWYSVQKPKDTMIIIDSRPVAPGQGFRKGSLPVKY